MIFRVAHHTEYLYRHPASESFAELRVCPRDTVGAGQPTLQLMEIKDNTVSTLQRVIKRRLDLDPQVAVDSYVDFFGNSVEFFSIPFRHTRLVVKASAEIETLPPVDPGPVLDISLAEARQIGNSRMIELHDYLQPTEQVELHHILLPLRKNFFRTSDRLGEALLSLNQWIFSHFEYVPGSTDVSTPLKQVVKQRKGVCQDFAHLMLSILRTYGIPARYVSGYIEAHDPTVSDPALVGATASHAWVEVFLPGGLWWGLDPTNNQVAGERHVRVAVGRDYRDCAPLKGTYKGALDQKLRVLVSVRRKPEKTTAVAA
jgi:transglutaminase-like putative cysteine protease